MSLPFLQPAFLKPSLSPPSSPALLHSTSKYPKIEVQGTCPHPYPLASDWSPTDGKGIGTSPIWPEEHEESRAAWGAVLLHISEY